MERVALHNLGCKVNAYETEAMQQRLEEAGYQIVPFTEKADIYIINTCTVTNIADRKSRQMLHRAKRQNPQAIVIAAGCYVQASKEECEADSAVDLIVGNNRKKDIVQMIEEFKQHRQQISETVIAINDTKEYEDMPITQLENHTRAIMKIQDGCNQFCTYCIIPYVRGRVRSRRLDSVVEEATILARQGYKEIVLTGIHLSSYGVDLKDGETKTLLTVLQQLHQIPGVERIRLGSLEPRIITEEFAAAISQLPKVCPHFHLSLQSGCDSVLRRMHRFYSTQEYLETCNLLRKYYKNPAITTDVIVGFPGETQEEFLCTEKFLETVLFFEMHIFKYSKRSGTKAALIPDQVEESIKAERSSRLLQLEKKMSNQYREQWIGQKVEVLIEEIVSIHGFFYWVGHTIEYIKVAVKIVEGFETTEIGRKEIGIEGWDREDFKGNKIRISTEKIEIDKKKAEKDKEADKKIGQIVLVKVTGKILEDTLFGMID